MINIFQYLWSRLFSFKNGSVCTGNIRMASGYLTLKTLVALPEKVPHYTTFRIITEKIKIHEKKKYISKENIGFIFPSKPSLGLETGHFCPCVL